MLVNNAGITSVGRKDLLEATEESWDTVFATNLKGPFFLAQLAAREMIELIEAKADQPRHDRQRLVDLGLCRLDEPRRLLHGQGGDADDDLAPWPIGWPSSGSTSMKSAPA